ncbi:MAG TPA: hypothetical protein V6D23_24415 [Candidatus Obscuribacterales bacterium]
MSETLSDTLSEHLSSLSASPRLAETLHLFLEGQPAAAAGQEPWEIFLPWVTGHDPGALSERLSALKDGLPVPGPVDQRPARPEVELDQAFASADRRTVKVFRELLKQERKSSKYYRELQHVFERNPDDQRLARLLLSYLLRWEGPESAAHFARHQLGLHPDWLNLRCAWASQVMFRTNPRQPEPEQLASFLDILQHQLLLEQHLSEGQTPDTDTAQLFYQSIAFFHLLQRQLERAVFAINQAAELDPQNPLLVVVMMAFTAIAVEDPERAKQLRDFLRPLMEKK